MNIIFSKAYAVLTSFAIGVSVLLTPTPAITPNLSGTYDIPTPVALFETSLATAITPTATSMNLVSALDKKGTALASSTYGFVIDSGKAEEEMVIADCTGTVCTNMTRGIDPITGTTTVTTLEFAHRRGASIKITDGPQLLILSRIINGVGTLPNKLSYKTGTACTVSDGNQTICDKAYVDSVGSSGASDANETTKGIIELATAGEARAGTSLGGTSARLVIPNSMATSSNDVAETHLVVTQANGYIKQNFIDTAENYTFSGINTFATTSTATSTVTGSFVSSGAATFVNMSVSGSASTSNITISGTQTGGNWSYTASSTNCNVTSGTISFANTIPANANFGLLSVTVEDTDAVQRGTMMLSRAIQDGTGIYFDYGTVVPATNDGNYRFTWSGSTLTIQELTDDSGDSSLGCIAYWFK